MKDRPDYLLRIPKHLLEDNRRTINIGHHTAGTSIPKYLLSLIQRGLAEDTARFAERIARKQT